MSLTSHLKDKNSPILQFLRTQFPNTRSFLAEARKQIRAAGTIVPDEDVPWGVVGMALDYRIRYYFGTTPREEFVAYKGARMLTDAQLIILPARLGYTWTGNVEDTIYIFDKRTGKTLLRYFPDIDGSFGASGPGIDDSLILEAHEFASRVVSGEIICSADDIVPLRNEYRDFFESLNDFLECNSPVGKRLEKAQEDTLNRYCVVLTLMEEVARIGIRPDSVLFSGDYNDAEALLAIAQPHWIDDLRELSWEFYDRHNHLLRLPHVLNPTFEGSIDVGGADADLIVDGILIDIKTTKRQLIDLDSVRQVLGYVLLDYSDYHRIDSVGLYLARQGVLVQWSLEDIIKGLCSAKTTSIKELRSEFRQCIEDFQASRGDVI